VIGVPRDQVRTFKHPGVGATLYGDLRCYSHLPKTQWVENRWTNAGSRQELLAVLDKRPFDRKWISSRERSERADIGMTEFKAIAISPTSQRSIGASYVPVGRDIAQIINGQRVVKTIECSGTHDPDLPLGTADRCDIWIYLGPGLWVEFSVYQQSIAVLPELHDQMLNYFETHRRK
jgi:hypothetical protein